MAEKGTSKNSSLHGRTLLLLITIFLIASTLPWVQGKRPQRLQGGKRIVSRREDELDKSVKKVLYEPRATDLRIFNPVDYLLDLKRDYLKKNQMEFQRQIHFQIIQRHDRKNIKKRIQASK